MTCREAIGILAEYLDRTLSRRDVARLEAHLAECEECRAYFATYRTTRALATEASRVEMPAEMKRRLRDFLLEQLEAK